MLKASKSSLSEWAKEQDKRSPKLRLLRAKVAKAQKGRIKPKKLSKREFNRSWGLPEDYQLRWKGHGGLEGVAWYYLSQLRRKEDAKNWGRCVSCPMPLAWNEGDGGHYISVTRSPGMKLQEDNVYLQSKNCNNPTWTPDASLPFGEEIDRRTYKGKALELWEQSKRYNASLSEIELLAKIAEWRERLARL